MRFLSSTERKRENEKKIIQNSKINRLEGKLTNKRIRWYGHVSRMNEVRIAKNVLNIKAIGKCPTGRLRSKWEQQVRKGVMQKEEHEKKRRKRRSCGKTQIERQTDRYREGEAWL
jgi:predicted NAD-dependent protein-ADP-ribosyltransferase YbiA (DUF1768 family)